MRVSVCEPEFGQGELNNVIDCMRSGQISGYAGRYLDEFEDRFSEYCGCEYGVATTSCATAMLLTLESLGIGKGDEVITSAFTMIATVNAIIKAGAKPVLVDCEPETWNINPYGIVWKITPKTRAIMPVHIYGLPCEMDYISGVADKHGLYVIEDAAEAIGAKYHGKRAGGLGTAGCFSFYINKTISCFPKGTKVLVKPPLGKRGLSRMRSIEDIKPHDMVLTYNEKNAKKEYKEVTRTFARGYHNKLLELKFFNNNHITLTPEHPIYSLARGWIKANDLEVGEGVIQYIYRGLVKKEKFSGKSYEEIWGSDVAIKRKMTHSGKIQQRHKEQSSGYTNMYTDKWRNKIRMANLGHITSNEQREKMSKAQLRRWEGMSEEERSKVCETMRIVNTRPEVKKRRQEVARQFAKDPVYRQKLSRGVRKAMRKESYWLNYTKAMNMKPNKPEKFLMGFLDREFPSEFGYNGDYRLRVRIDRLIPDFVHRNGKNKVIDVLGRHWHSEEEVRERVSRYKKCGFDSLMLWEDELTDENSLHQRVEAFLYNPNIKIVVLKEKREKGYDGKVYNIETEENHNYFVYGILVHNCGEGGMITTNDKELADKARLLRGYATNPEKRFTHDLIGFNYRLTNLQASIGVAQMDKIDEFVGKKRWIARRYTERLKDVGGLCLPRDVRRTKNAYWVYALLVEDEFGISRDELRQRFADKGVETRTFFVPMNKQPALNNIGLFRNEQCPVAEDISRRGLYLPNGVGLTAEQIDYVCDCLILCRR